MELGEETPPSWGLSLWAQNIQAIELLATLRFLTREACLKIGSQGGNDRRDRPFVRQLMDRRAVEYFHIEEPPIPLLVDSQRETMIERRLRFTVLLHSRWFHQCIYLPL